MCKGEKKHNPGPLTQKSDTGIEQNCTQVGPGSCGGQNSHNSGYFFFYPFTLKIDPAISRDLSSIRKGYDSGLVQGSQYERSIIGVGNLDRDPH